MNTQQILHKYEFFKGKNIDHMVDNLTGIWGRECLGEYVNWLITNKKPFSLFIIDIDNFKNVNDTYGHLIGDEVLRQTAKHFIESTKESGVVFRFGGDEFIMVYEGVSSYDDVWRIGHNLDFSTGKLKFEGIPNFAITISVGISRCPLNGDNFQEILKLADNALYRAKMKGRNCFVIYLPDKHLNISLQEEREKQLTSMQLVFNIFNNATSCGEDIPTAISNVFKGIVSYYMYDHVCIETKSGINHSVVHKLSKCKHFKHISYDMIDKHIGTIGSFKINHTSNISEEEPISWEYRKQHICSTYYCKISAYGTDYGFIRVDMTSNVRIWQNTEMSIIMTAANYLGLMLHYQNKTLDELPPVPQIQAGSID